MDFSSKSLNSVHFFLGDVYPFGSHCYHVRNCSFSCHWECEHTDNSILSEYQLRLDASIAHSDVGYIDVAANQL